MEHDEALLDSLATLRDAHEKASRLMAEIAALAARAVKRRGEIPSLVQLQNYQQALAQAQRQAALCEELLLGGSSPAVTGAAADNRSHVH